MPCRFVGAMQADEQHMPDIALRQDIPELSCIIISLRGPHEVQTGTSEEHCYSSDIYAGDDPGVPTYHEYPSTAYSRIMSARMFMDIRGMNTFVSCLGTQPPRDADVPACPHPGRSLKCLES